MFAILNLVMATKQKKAQAEKNPTDESIHVRAPKGDKFKNDLEEMAQGQKRSLNEFCVAIFKHYIKNPVNVF